MLILELFVPTTFRKSQGKLLRWPSFPHFSEFAWRDAASGLFQIVLQRDGAALIDFVAG